jgi:hypothetical protein
MENEGAVVPAGEVRYDLSVARSPQQVVAEAMNAAKALAVIIKQKPKPIIMNGEQYLEFEDWQTCGKFYGVTSKVVSTEHIEIGGAKGFLAKAEAILVSSGVAVSAAEAMCMNDEDKWSTRTKYDYKDGKREAVGTVPVPMFQLRSMAQTRACAKALRNVLAWVVVMAGFKPNVAEEMIGNEAEGSGPPPEPPRPKAAQSADGVISEAQAKRFYAIGKSAGKTDDEMRAYVLDQIGVESSKLIPKSQYEMACDWAAKKPE